MGSSKMAEHSTSYERNKIVIMGFSKMAIPLLCRCGRCQRWCRRRGRRTSCHHGTSGLRVPVPPISFSWRRWAASGTVLSWPPRQTPLDLDEVDCVGVDEHPLTPVLSSPRC